MLFYIITAIGTFVISWFIFYRDVRERKKILCVKEHAFSEEKELHNEEVAIAKANLKKKHDEIERFQNTKQQEFERLMNEAKELKSELNHGFLRGRKWLADAYSEFISTRDTEVECSLAIRPNPALKAAETVAQLRTKRVEMVRKLKIAEYQLASYEEYFPFLLDYRDAILDEVVDLRTGDVDAIEDLDPALKFGFLNKEEYDNLSTVEKFQMALDRYWQKKKSKLEIGRLYERYIGYLYEIEGWVVIYQGIIKGFEDFGRDLICKKNGHVLVVQCKCWAKDKVIREKHILQLYGTCILYRVTEHHNQVKPVFATTTSLSDDANMVASELDIEVRHQDIERYPMIKCNINPSSNERIYHLPFDQQYDRIIIGDQDGEFYATTVKEAEDAGFRRAYRWRGYYKESTI